jgi:hypothetical protein
MIVLLAHPAVAATCPHDNLKMWQDNYASGDRALSILTSPISPPHGGPGHTAQINCFTKGARSNDEVLDPYTSNLVAGALQRYTSKMPCQLFNGATTTTAAGFLWNANINGPVGASSKNNTECTTECSNEFINRCMPGKSNDAYCLCRAELDANPITTPPLKTECVSECTDTPAMTTAKASETCTSSRNGTAASGTNANSTDGCGNTLAAGVCQVRPVCLVMVFAFGVARMGP